jgi:4-hydroxy-2-oxoheptanedioate aldolase
VIGSKLEGSTVMTSMKDRIHKSKDSLGGYLCMIPSAMVSQALAAAGADWLIIDQEHAPIGPENLHAMIAATAGTACSPWVRVPRRDEAFVKPALDAGAEGIMFPLVRTAAEAAECVALTTYPPRGRRGWGPFAAHSRWGVELFDYLGKRGGETVCGLLIETKAAVDNIEEICKVEGIDYMVLATFDLSTELGVSGKLDAPVVLEAVRHAEQAILKAGIALGAAAFTKEQAQANLRRGHRLFFYGFDVLMLKQHVRQACAWLAP